MKTKSYCNVKQKSPYFISYVPGMTGRDYRDILEMMLHGIDIALVDPDIFPHLDSTLSIYLEQYTEKKDELVLSKLEFYKKYIDELPRRQEIAALLSKEPPPPPVIIPALTPEQVDEEVDLILKTAKIKYFKPDELDLVLEGLRKKRAEFIADGNYLDAEKAEHFTKAVMSYGQLGYVEHLQGSKVVELQNKLKESRDQLQQKKMHWEELHSKLRESANRELKGLQRSHQKEIQELEDLYDQQPPPSVYKYSNVLLSMRRKEKAMLQSRRFAEAGKMKIDADNLEKIENEQQTQKWHELIALKIKNAKMKHEKALVGRKNYWKKEEITLVNQANKEVEKDERAILHLEKSLDVAKGAKNLAENMKNDSTNVKSTDSSGLPPLNQQRSSMTRAMAHRQRAILNHKIYTRVPRPKTQLQ
ncbi:hypothetical protein TRFO_18079 [Tritrichomonas foetus]|uniref:Uncharacterized protein n=1 Tax=Tritrichomonas foetus TaxID=1144522 RepID=A0A1J4KLS6_9EUKA|nr:hypothetical protein TRFO_18079 [Tritrichomonas foetus]|eukprot:OHT12263.1 hypothetical protein TRFO_18079 [Tritrichomonas foetus]